MRLEDPADCVFCRIARGELNPEVLALRDGHTAAFPSLYQQPQNQGHMLVVPARHIAQIYEVGDDLAGPFMTTIARVAAAVKKAFDADGITIRQNNERHGGQDVFHVHFHVIPRFAGDGFNTGDDRYPYGAIEVPLARRIEQAAMLSEALGQGRYGSSWPWPESLDALVAAPAQHRLIFENARVRVLDTRIAPGERTPTHTHQWPAVHYVMSWSDFVRRDADGAVLLDTRQAGGNGANATREAIWGDALPPHSLQNVGAAPLHIISTELKSMSTRS